MKRFFDLLTGLALAPFAFLVVMLAALAVRLETPGSPIFLQTRVGRNLKPFKMLKLRTMHSGTASVPSHQIGATSITRVGKLLRKTKVDELPQIWAVVTGAMSLVGPRPCLPQQKELIGARNDLGVFSARPGITGKAQVMGVDMSEPHRLAAIDADYVSNRSFFGDLRLIAATVLGKGYYDAADNPKQER